VAVLVGGEPVRHYGPGEGVGDPALVPGAPRSATARADGPVDTLAIAAVDFLAAVTRRPGSHKGAAGLGHHRPHLWRRGTHAVDTPAGAPATPPT
jgi:hypothetical protein